MRVTIRDVAEQARVSPATVSLVLNNAPGVSARTREKVMRIVDEINYKPDALARNFSSGKSEAIALIMPPHLESLNDPYFMNLLRGVLEATRDRGYTMILEIADERFISQNLWDELLQRKRVDGLVIATPLLDQAYLHGIIDREYHALLINGARPDLPQLDFVGYDDVRCALDATYYLLGLGHQRIAHIAGPQNQASGVQRLQGYRQALERARIPYRQEDVLFGDYLPDSGADAMRQLTSRPCSERPTAIFCANDTMAIAAIETAREAGLEVPTDLSIIGVDDTGAAERCDPPLTTMRQDVHALSYRATFSFVRNRQEKKQEILNERIPMTLIERSSCAPAAERR